MALRGAYVPTGTQGQHADSSGVLTDIPRRSIDTTCPRTHPPTPTPTRPPAPAPHPHPHPHPRTGFPAPNLGKVRDSIYPLQMREDFVVMTPQPVYVLPRDHKFHGGEFYSQNGAWRCVFAEAVKWLAACGVGLGSCGRKARGASSGPARRAQ